MGVLACRVLGFELFNFGGYHDWQSACSELQNLVGAFASID